MRRPGTLCAFESCTKYEWLKPIEEQVEKLVEIAMKRLDDLSHNTLVELFDLLELDLVRVGDTRFQGEASIPIPENGGEVWPAAPRASNRSQRAPRDA